MTELSNLCGLAQVRAVKKSCHAALSCHADKGTGGAGAALLELQREGPTLLKLPTFQRAGVTVTVVWTMRICVIVYYSFRSAALN